jgi:hypothetical protein
LFLVPPARIELATCAGANAPVPVEPQYVFGADTFCNPKLETKSGERHRSRCLLSADLPYGRFFSAREIFVS